MFLPLDHYLQVILLLNETDYLTLLVLLTVFSEMNFIRGIAFNPLASLNLYSMQPRFKKMVSFISHSCCHPWSGK